MSSVMSQDSRGTSFVLWCPLNGYRGDRYFCQECSKSLHLPKIVLHYSVSWEYNYVLEIIIICTCIFIFSCELFELLPMVGSVAGGGTFC